MTAITENENPGRWWVVALFVAIISVVLIVLLWNFPTSMWVWLLAVGILIFVVVCYFNPRYRYWHRANWCFGIAAGLAIVPTIITKLSYEGIGSFEFVSESSSIVVLGFLAVGLTLSWLDFRQHVSSSAKSETSTTNRNLQAVNSSNTIMGLNAGENIIISQGISEDTLLAVIKAQQSTNQSFPDCGNEPNVVDEELVWRLIEDIKEARQRLEGELVAKHIGVLRKSFEGCGNNWSKILRTEAIILMAEVEGAKISQSRANGHPVDLTTFQSLLKELQND